MSLVSLRRKEPELPPVPKFLQAEQSQGFAQLERDMGAAIKAAPRGMADPMHPDVAKLLSAGIIAAAKKYTEEVLIAPRRFKEDADAYLADVEAWAATVVAEAEGIARDVAERHASMVSNRDKFKSISSPEPEAPAEQPAPQGEPPPAAAAE